ncbi:MAG: hypothetical protein ABIP29_09955 [Candidatus Eisenbacteria bacterium]
MRSPAGYLAPTLLALTLGLTACAGCGGRSDPTGPAPGPGTPTRTYRMGFSGIPPRPDLAQGVAAIQMWSVRSDGAILHLEPPWDSLLAGVPAETLLVREQKPLAEYYRARGLDVVVTLDATDGLNRAAEAPGLVAAGRSLGEVAVQAAYRAYAVAVNDLLQPSRLGFAAETNLIRAAASPGLYAAVVSAANGAAADVRARDAGVRLYVSVQVEVAWNRLASPAPPPGAPTYVGVAQDLADFPFAQDIGLSSYPYLGGFSEPEQVPLDWYRRVRDEVARPVLVVEGGWTSGSVGGSNSDPARQARWWRRNLTLADQAQAVGLYQLTFTDLDLASFPPQPPGSILPLFAQLGLVTADLAAKPALAVWDSAFARRLD